VTVPDEQPAPGFAGAEIPTPPIPDDDGHVSPQLRRELLDLAGGRGSGARVLQALAAARLFVPVVAVLESESVNAVGVRQEKQSAMATVLVDSPEHGRALLAFSGVESLALWRQDARPVAMPAPLAARAAIGESADALLVDVAGPTPFALTGDELLLVAAVARPPEAPVSDPVLLRAVERVVNRVVPDGGTRVELDPGEPDQPLRLQIFGVGSTRGREMLLDRLSREQVINRLVPQGLRVSFHDTL
jgi:hypothetical protein